ncbi:hypothetical protein BHF68_10410 [Desulfuribacillus alkaliarsenatis]|uniref:Uncharacterized protein n=1 Tax=Desulfuribacillus alkaliarsenatis TaxID=766136 RepID=A0A1E5FZW7_9FIRM|nr:hypothetical protein BHF68_10410 [Desulfuribacillus alkaliarsenatis]
MRGVQIGFGEEHYKYKLEIPKKVFDVYNQTSKERVNVTIEGFFTKDDKLIFGVSDGYEAALIENYNNK